MYSMTSGASVDPVVYDTLQQFYSKSTTTQHHCTNNTETENTGFPKFGR